MQVKTCMFDVYGTLFDVYSLQQLCETYFPGKGEAIVKLWRAKQLEYSFLRHIMGKYEPFYRITGDALRYACEFHHAALSEEQEQCLLGQYVHLSLYEDARELLGQTGTRTLAAFSNGSPDMLLPLLANAGISQLFHYCISVDDIHMYKPAPAVYEFARQRVSAAKEEVLFFSSNTWDISGAKHFGFQTVWVNRSGLPMDRLGVRPDYEVQNLREAIALLA